MKLTLTFKDGTTKTIELKNAIEIDVKGPHKQSIEFRQTNGDTWIMSFTKSFFDGKKISKIEAVNEE
jgi:hypothetical protein